MLYDIGWLISEGRQHWKHYLPKLYRRLKNAGVLERSLSQAAEQTKAAMEMLEKSGFTPDEAWPEVRSEFLILDPRHYNQPEAK